MTYLTTALVVMVLFPSMKARAAQGTKSIPALFIVGDSTAHVNGNPKYGVRKRVGWGTEFPVYFNPAKIRVVNAAAAGRSFSIASIRRRSRALGSTDNAPRQ